MKYAIEPMATRDIGEVLQVDRESYSLPWPASAYRREIQHNQQARYIVLREVDHELTIRPVEPVERPRTWRSLLPWLRTDDESGAARRGRIVGYAGMWMMADEAHITTIAVRRTLRGKGLGELLLASLIDMARHVGARWVTLEVRVSNDVAQRLYLKYGFHEAGRRRRYYSDNNEDAYIMTTDDITTGAYQGRFYALKSALEQRLQEIEAIQASAPALPGAHAD